MKLYPIINFNLNGSQMNPEDVSQIYAFVVDSVCDWALRTNNQDRIESLEFSLASTAMADELINIKDILDQKKIKFSFGSFISLDQAWDLKAKFGDSLEQPIELFAPAFDADIYDFILEDKFASEYFDYIPGVYSKTDVDELLKTYDSPSKLKIFPLKLNSPKDLLKALEAPYPELKMHKFQSRLITLSDELAKEYKVYEKFEASESSALIKSPSDYHKIRKKFMVNQKLKLLFKSEKRDLNELIQYIKVRSPNTKIVLTGFGDDLRKTCDLKDVDFIATRMFRSVVFDLIAGSINTDQARELIANELDQYSIVLT